MSIFEIRKRYSIDAGGVVIKPETRGRGFFISQDAAEFLNGVAAQEHAHYIKVVFLNRQREEMYQIDVAL